MGNKIVTAIALVVSFVLLNIFSRFLYSQAWFSTTTLSKEVNPFDIITLVITSLLTIWLGWYVSKKITEQRYKKEYLINDLKEIEEELKFIEKSMQVSNIELQSLISFLNKLETCIHRFCKTIEIFQISSFDASSLNLQYKNLFERTTNLDGNLLVLDEVNRNEINKVCADFVIEVRSMIFKINSL